jgi:cytochrome bd ubiquinol oxidase subunit II
MNGGPNRGPCDCASAHPRGVGWYGAHHQNSLLSGGGLWVAFPQAYAVIMPALYLPVIVMLLALVFRGVAFEFRSVAVTSKKYWNFAFAAGSTVAGICQGLILGGLIQGIKVENGVFAGGPFDWATPFALLCGIGVVTGYALLGATWLVMKTEGPVAERARLIGDPDTAF